jgi:hypothetical protein
MPCPRLEVHGEMSVRPQRRVVHGMLPAAKVRSCACVGGILQAGSDTWAPYLAARCTSKMPLGSSRRLCIRHHLSRRATRSAVLFEAVLQIKVPCHS